MISNSSTPLDSLQTLWCRTDAGSMGAVIARGVLIIVAPAVFGRRLGLT